MIRPPPRVHQAVLLCLATLLLVPSVMASPGALEVSASSLQAGHATVLQAPLRALVLDHEREGPPVGPLLLYLEAEVLVLEMDQTELYVDEESLSALRPPHSTHREEFTYATVSSQEVRPGHRLLIATGDPSTAHLSTESSCGHLEPPDRDSIEEHALVATHPARPPLVVDTSTALTWRDCSPETALHLTGDFMLGLWQWDFLLESPDGTSEYQTGTQAHPWTPGATGPGASAGPGREAYLSVQGGNLTILFAKEARPAIYADREATLVSESGFLLHDAHGTFHQASSRLDVAGNEIYAAGTLEARVIDPAGWPPLALRLEGDFQGLRVDERNIPLPVATPSPPAPTTTGNAALVAAPLLPVTLLASGAVWAVRRRALTYGLSGGYSALGHMPPTKQARSLHETAFRHHAARRNRAAVWCLNKAIRIDPDEATHYALRARCHSSLGHPRRSLQDHLEAHANALGDVAAAESAYHISRAYGQLGRAQQAAHWLRIAMHTDPHYVDLATCEPAYERVADHHLMRELLPSRPPPRSARTRPKPPIHP